VVVGLIGHRIAYSASPAMHTAAFRATGLEDWRYELWDVPSQEVRAAVDRLRDDDCAGANVTIPYKLRALELADDVDPLAKRVGAVNTLVRRGKRLVGFNTDVDGVRTALEEIGWRAGTAVVLGRGGAARAAQVALGDADVVMVTREDWEHRRELARSADVVINCTPLGRAGEVVLEPHDLPAKGAVIDLVYIRGGTPLVNAALAAGIPVADGWTVLLAQGAAAFQHWTGVPAPVAAMRGAIQA
jgi:shikimate dehydrogenase